MGEQQKQTRELVEGTLRSGKKVQGELVERNGKTFVLVRGGRRRSIDDFRVFKMIPEFGLA